VQHAAGNEDPPPRLVRCPALAVLPKDLLHSLQGSGHVQQAFDIGFPEE